MRLLAFTLAGAMAMAACSASPSGGGPPPADTDPTPQSNGVDLNFVIPEMSISAHAIVWGGSWYGVVWWGLPLGETEYVVQFARLSANGNLAAPPVEIDRGSSAKYVHIFANAGGGYVIWFLRGSRARAMVIDAAGTVLIGPSSMPTAVYMDVAQRGAGYDLITSHRPAAVDYDMFFQSYDASLTAVGASKQIEATTDSQLDPAITWVESRSEYKVLWRESYEIYHGWIDPAVGQVGTSPQLYDMTERLSGPRAIADTTGNLLIHFQEETDRTAFLYHDGTQRLWIERRHLLPENRRESQDLDWAARGDEIFLAWQDNSATPLGQIWFARTNPAAGQLAIRDARLLSVPGNYYFTPRIAVTPDAVGVTFIAEMDGTRRLFFQRVEL